MTINLTEQQVMIQDMARRFALEQLAPHSASWDQEKHFPLDIIRSSAALGFAGIYVDEAVGGSALGRLEAVLIFEQLSYGDVPTAAFISIHNMASWMIDRFGTDDQRRTWVPQLTSMQQIASYCLTEPGSGSDAAAMKTRAVQKDDVYILNGTKQFISGAGASELYVLMARTGDTGPHGVSAFILPLGTPGLSFGPNERKMGWNSQPTRQLIPENVHIPVANRIGAPGQGFKFAMAGLDGGRLNIAACSLGGAQRALDKALVYARERQQFGQPLSDFQAIQFKLADMETELQAARMMLYQAATRLDAKADDATRWCAMAKRFVTDTAFKVANEALQIHGGYGYLSDYGVEQIVRDLRVHQILEGTNEIMRVIISRDLLKTQRPLT